MSVRFELDGRPVELPNNEESSLLDVLRGGLAETGPKAGCRIGRCGACVVLVGGRPFNACLMPVERLDGLQVTTRDGLVGEKKIVAALTEECAFQCGACANGMIVTLTYLRQNFPQMKPDEVMALMAGHLCRCSGYQGLYRAVRRLCDLDAKGA